MPLDPLLEPLVAAAPQLPEEIEDFDAYRAQEEANSAGALFDILEPAPEGATRREVQIPVKNGSITLHIFTPATPGPHPAHLYLHGGGWIGGSIHSKYTAVVCAERAVLADCVVVTAEYRKAPEYKFPTAIDDSYAALLWTVDHALVLGIQPGLITIGGGSAGANLAAGVALKSRDEAGPRLALQILEVPALDLTLAAPSYARYGTGYGITSQYMKTCVRYYLDKPEDVRHPYASPLLATDVSGLPPAYILPAECDPLCDDGEAYARRLVESGVPATNSLQHGQIHGSAALTKLLPAARAWRDEVIEVLRRTHAAETGEGL